MGNPVTLGGSLLGSDRLLLSASSFPSKRAPEATRRAIQIIPSLIE